MVDRYQDRHFPADDGYGHGDDQHAPARAESDPLAELARLIGQTDPFANIGRANQQVPPRSAPRDQYQSEQTDEDPPAGPPPWMQRAARQETPTPSYHDDPDPAEDHAEPDYPAAEHPLRRYAAQHAEPAPEPEHEEYDPAPAYAEADPTLDPARYDDALYGELVAAGHDNPQDQAYQDDAYAYQDGYDDGEEPVQKRRGGLATVIVVLALAVVGTGAAFAYRTYVGSPRSGEPPIIRADTSPTKIVPAAADSTGKVPDRLAAGDGTEKIVPREEAPVDVNANTQSGPRMVFPPLNQNANPPSPASVSTNGLPPANAANGTMPNNQPRAIKTFTVRGDQPDAGTPAASASQQPTAAKPAAATAAHASRTPSAASAANANASASIANAPMSLSPQAVAQPAPAPAAPSRVATNAPVPIAPAAASSGGGYLVQVSSQKNEADAESSYRVLQGKYPSVLGSQSVLVKRVDLGEKGIYYRAFAGPFSSVDQATQVCSSLKAAGGPQCIIQRN
jgi:cell division protein FtsN